MPKLTIEVELSERLYRAYECEAARRGDKLERLVERLVNELIRDMEREVNEPPILFS